MFEENKENSDQNVQRNQIEDSYITGYFPKSEFVLGSNMMDQHK